MPLKDYGFAWGRSRLFRGSRSAGARALRVDGPNPKLKLLEQIREVMRSKHYAIWSKQSYRDWGRRYSKLHGMKCREELFVGEPKAEAFLSDLVVRGQVAAARTGIAKSAGRDRYPLPGTARCISQ